MKAIAYILSNQNISGNVFFEEIQYTNKLKITVNVSGLSPGLHGFHIHEFADFRKGFKSLGSHFNPTKDHHAGPKSHHRHLGDLGNIFANDKGIVNETKFIDKLRIKGKYGVIGRSVIIHEKKDDMGLGKNQESKKTGNAGARIAAGVIGYLK